MRPRFARHGLAVLLIAGGAIAAAAAPAPAPSSNPPAGWAEIIERLGLGQPIQAAGCCKTCRAGKACGDSCISASKSCSKGKGCACNG